MLVVYWVFDDWEKTKAVPFAIVTLTLTVTDVFPFAMDSTVISSGDPAQLTMLPICIIGVKDVKGIICVSTTVLSLTIADPVNKLNSDFSVAATL